MQEQEWKVICYFSGFEVEEIVRGWKPILRLIRQARDTKGVRYVDVGPKIGAPYIGVRFMMKGV